MSEQEVPISDDEKKKALQSAIFHLSNQQPFYGSLVQEITVKYTTFIPTAGITYNVKQHQYEIYINPYFFHSLTTEERVAVFHHEILHFTNKHLFRLPFTDGTISNEDKKLYNIAGDMAINQYITGLPKGGVEVKDWKMSNGSPFEQYQNMEYYYDLIKEESKKQQKNKDGDEPGEQSKDGNEESKGTKGNVHEQLDKYKEFDRHFWDSLDEETKKKMLEEAKKIIKRTIEKTSFSHSVVPDSIKDLLSEIDSLSASINYKQILKNTIKRTISCVDRERTWKKPNKRYGAYSPGTKVGSLPKCAFFNDSSGSISIKEQNEYLRMMDEFLKVGTRSCTLGFWHTSLYYKKPYKRGIELDQEALQSGGTDVRCVLEDIKKNNYNLSIIFTDGYYDNVDIKLTNEIIWIISKDGNLDHPLKHLGKTIELDKIK